MHLYDARLHCQFPSVIWAIFLNGSISMVTSPFIR
jgi:hypothetical protein